MTTEIDFGAGHTGRWVRWAPDDLPANRERYGVPLPVVEKACLVVRHLTPTGAVCESAIHPDIPEASLMFGADAPRHVWRVESWDPLTLSPSLLCRRCGDHGFIREGRWVPA